MNKSRSLFLLSILAVLFAACEEGIIDNAILSQDYSEPEYAISVSPGELSFSAEGGEEDITLELTRSLSWTATTNDSWITLPTHSGDDSPTSVIHILVAENTSLENRIGTITFKTRGKTATLTVRQEGVEPFLSTDVQTLTFPSDGGAQQVQISTNGNWTATTKSESAFSVSPASGTGEGTLTVTAAENETTVLRWETLTLTSGALTVSITLLQQAKPDLNGHAYVDLALPSGLLWATCNVGATTPEEYGDYFAWGETAKKNSYTWANYKWSDGGMQSLTKYNNRSDYGIVDNLSELLLSDDAAVVNWGGCWRMPTHAEWEELCNTDNCTWTPMNNNGHCEGYKVTSTRNGNSIFLPSAGLYTESGLDRANLNGYFWASTMFSVPDQGYGLYFDDAGHPHAFSRYQGLSVRPVGKMTLHFSLTPTTINFPATSSSETLSVTANQPWTATTSDVWLTLSNTSGEGDATLSLTAEENTSITSRTGTVTFQTGATTYTVSVTQEGATPVFEVTPTSLSYSASGGSETVTITSNQSWTATTSDAWLSISEAAGEGNATLTITAEENTSIAERTGKVTFSAGGKTYTVSITQKGADPILNVTPESLSFSAEGGNKSISVTSNSSWTASSSDAWLTLSNDSGEGDATLTMTAQENTSIANRTASVTIKGEGGTFTINVTQEGAIPLFDVTPTLRSFTAEGGSTPINVSSNQTWTASVSADWITLSAMEGTGNATLSLTVEANTSIAERTGTVIFSAGGKTYTVSITQKGATPILRVTPESLSFTAEGGNNSISVTSNSSWTATSSDAWLTLSINSGEGDATLTLMAEENTSTSSRTASVTFKGKDTSFTVNVTQEGASPAFSVTPTTLSFTSSGGSQSVSIKSNQTWTASFDVSWLSLSTASGTGDATVSITAQANTYTDNRAGTVTFTSGGKTYTVTVIQDGAAIHFEITPTTITFTAKGGSKSVSVMSNQPWTVSSDVSWLKLSNSSGTSDATLSVTAEENTSTSSRSSTIIFKAGGKDYTVSITQEGATPFFNVSPESLSFSSSGESKSLSITSNISWTVSSDASWLKLSDNSGTSDATLSVTAEENTITSSRSGTVTFSAGGNSYTVNVTQEGAVEKKPYLTFEALENTTFTFSQNDLQFSLDEGATWTTLPAGTATPTLQAGERIMWKASGLTPSESVGIGKFSSTGKFNAEGNIMSLLYGDVFVGQTSLNGKDYAFCQLFANSSVVNAENLVLPATTLADYCYQYMFRDCTNLTTAPELPATTLVNRCYYGMFYGCTSLTTAPELPATTLADYCYAWMFDGCTSLTTAPELPATTLATYCYWGMFTYCTSLATAPELPATTLTKYCYDGMFTGCTSLATAPELPATTLANFCYYGMFSGCTSLTTAPKLPATTLADKCYYRMFWNCTSLTTASELPATALAVGCYYNMFMGCTHLNYIKCLATDISATDCTTNWVYGVASSGTFVKNVSMKSWTTGDSGIPSGWTVKDFPEGGNTEDHEYVDLGLPSGTLWATCNVGASSPEEYGDYFAWGETEPKSDFSWEKYKFRVSGDTWSNIVLSKYVTDSSYGTLDNKDVLDPSDDAATMNWGSIWRMPTDDDWTELRNAQNCTWEWTTKNGVYGSMVTSIRNGNSVFLPAGGWRNGSSLSDSNLGRVGCYWSSTLTIGPYSAYTMYFLGGGTTISPHHGGTNRPFGLSVRPVFKP